MVLTNEDIWGDFDNLLQAADDGGSIEISDFTLTTATVGAVLMFY